MSQFNPPPGNNPYATPSFDLNTSYARTGQRTESGLTDKTVQMLRQTRPWVIFISVMCFLGAALLLLMGCFMFVTLGLVPQAGPDPSARVGMGVGMAIAYGVMALMYLIPGVLLWQYGSKLGEFVSAPNIHRLDNALESQRSFWRAIGIMTIVVIVIYVGIIAIALVAGILAASMR
jgi:hypothetical protein